ncbi:MAG TPA: ester cyclase [Steroidobacteraceae bacterium]|nr:ester cyclase [Steroidobacteraceae bacterium]
MAKKSKRGRTGVKAKSRVTARPKRPARRKVAKAARGKRHSVAAQLARNKQLVLSFYQKMIGEKDFEAARPYMGAQYRQHAPYAADGHEGVAAWVQGFKAAFPNHRYEVKKVIAEGDLVMLHLHGMNGPNPYGESVVDIFRIENGKVVEHWDVIQAIPESADNANSMF